MNIGKLVAGSRLVCDECGNAGPGLRELVLARLPLAIILCPGCCQRLKHTLRVEMERPHLRIEP